jgi:hypothetical protein
MHKLSFVLAVLILLGTSDAMAQSVAGERFDGKWLTKLTCPAKGNTEGYTWQFPSVIQNNNLRGERGTAGEPGYLLIEGKIAEDGSAKLSATGIVSLQAIRPWSLGPQGRGLQLQRQGQVPRYGGHRHAETKGLGIVGRPCTFDFTKAAVHEPGR